MKKLIIPFLLLTTRLWATDGSATYSTLVRPITCSGAGHAANPITRVSAEDLGDTWSLSPTNTLDGLNYFPRTISAGGWTEVASGSVPNGGVHGQSKWVTINSMYYDGTCCNLHTAAWLGLEIKNITTFSGGLIGTNETRSTVRQYYFGPSFYGIDHIVLQIYHEVDNGSTRISQVNEGEFGQGVSCPPNDPKLQQYWRRIGTNTVLQIRGTTNQINTTALIYTNGVVSTNWLFASPVTLDSNAEADVDVSNWPMPESQGYFLLNYTNNP